MMNVIIVIEDCCFYENLGIDVCGIGWVFV